MRAVRFLGSGFGLGLLPKAPGTWGTLLGVALGALLYATAASIYVVVAVTLAVCGVGVYLARRAEREFGQKDPGWFVIDEVAGYLVVLIALPLMHNVGVTLVLAFLMFRLFDIFKPPPIRALEALPHGYGVMADDLVAGVYAHVALRIVAPLI